MTTLTDGIEQQIYETVRPEAARTEAGLRWSFDTNAELQSFVAKLNDMILNKLYYRDLKYSEAGSVFKNKDVEGVRIVVNITNYVVKVQVTE